MTHYIVWERSEEPTVDREKYVWYNEGICKIWDGFSWRIVNQTLGVLDESVIPLSIARKTDLMNLLRLLVVEGQIPNPDDPSNPIVGGDWVSRSDFEDELNKKVDKSEYNPFKEAVNGELIDHERRITALENDVDGLKDDVAALKNGGNSGGSGGGNQGGSEGGNQGGNNQGDGNSNVGRTFLIYAKTAGENVIPYVPGPNNLKWNVTYNILTGSFNTGCSDGSTVTWSTNNGNRVSGQYTWISMGSFGIDGNMIGVWSDPFCITSGGKDGINGRDGVDGTNIEFVFRLVNTNDINIALSIPAPIGTDEDDWHDNDWQDHPQGISPEYPIELVSYRKIVNENNKKWSNFSTPAIWAKWGEDGTDGDGVEYIFRVVNVESVEEVTRQDGSKTYRLKDDPALQLMPPRSETELVNGASVTSDVIIADFQNDEWVPGDAKQSFGWDRNWTDDPLDVSSGQPFEFVSIRKWNHNAGTWGYFSEPVLWGKFAWVDPTGFTAFAFTRTSKSIGSYVPYGGNAANPVPQTTYTDHVGGQVDNDIHWSDSIPASNDSNAVIWITTRIFGDGIENQGWTSPRQLSDTTGFQVEYSNNYPWETDPLNPYPELPSLNNSAYQGQESVGEDDGDGINESAWRQACSTQGLGDWTDEGNEIVDTVYMATCFKNSQGVWSNWNVSKIKGEAGQNGRSVDSITIFYKAFNNAVSNVSAPSTNLGVVNDAIDGWTKQAPVLTEQLDRLWTFTRVVYDDNTVYHSIPYCVRYLDAQAVIDYSDIEAVLNQAIGTNLESASNRLNRIDSIASTLTSEGGLTQILNQYNSSNNYANRKAFADIIANAAESTINLNVGETIWGADSQKTLSDVGIDLAAATSELDLYAQSLKDNGSVIDVRSRFSAIEGSLTSTVAKAQLCWVWPSNQITIRWGNVNVVVEKDSIWPYGIEGDTVDGEPNITKINTGESIDTYNTRLQNQGFVIQSTVKQMSAIKQTSDKVSILVGQDGSPDASVIIGSINSAAGRSGFVRLSADTIELNGQVIANAINARGPVQIGTLDNITGRYPITISSTGIDISKGTIKLGTYDSVTQHCPFEVDNNGNLYATSATISGTVTADKFISKSIDGSGNVTNGNNVQIIFGNASITPNVPNSLYFLY